MAARRTQPLVIEHSANEEIYTGKKKSSKRLLLIKSKIRVFHKENK